jgi:uncharacterized protein YydD (DUF2326 family)
MILKKLSLTPERLFEPVEFVKGINYIFGKKAKSTDTKNSLNGIGKSAFLDLLDFCLLANFNPRDSKRLHAAYQKGILKGISAELIFEVDGVEYILSRSFDNPGPVLFSKNGGSAAEYSVNDLKMDLCDLIFFKRSYPGHYSANWFRKLLRFYLKIQKPKKERFTDPIVYIKELDPTELNQYHLFLMDIDNSPAYENHRAQLKLKAIEPAIKGIKRFIAENYRLHDIPEAGSKARKLRIEIEELEKAVEAFKLSKLYTVDEERANKLTVEIKQLWFQNHVDRKKIDSYLESLKYDIDFSTRKIKNLYDQLNSLLAQQVKKTLDEAIRFKKQLIESRQEFLKEELEELKTRITAREKEIEKKEEERKTIFEFLNAKEAIKDLTGAFKALSDKKNQQLNIESQIKLFQDLNKQQNQVEQEIKKIEGAILEFKDAVANQELEIARLFSAVHDAIYPELKDTSIFDITPNPKSRSKIEINVLPNTRMFSKGRNQGRTLVYDLTILFNSINKNLNGPRFLVHDGIFDRMDKAHFIALYQFLEEQKMQGKDFQYIMTYNEEGTLTDNFGKADLVTTEKIETEAILVLTPGKKLLGDF